MSDRPQDRLLSEAFRLILARELPVGTNLRTQHEDTPQAGTPRPLPMIGIVASRTGEDYALTDADRQPADVMELRFECRADADAPGSGQALETLAELVKTAIASSTASAASVATLASSRDGTEEQQIEVHLVFILVVIVIAGSSRTVL